MGVGLRPSLDALHLRGHEVGHVWQNQNGGITIVGEALITQGLDAIGVGDGYAIGEALQQAWPLATDLSQHP